jgi:hypothetical protein
MIESDSIIETLSPDQRRFSVLNACRSSATEGTFSSLPDSSRYVLHENPGDPPGLISLPFIGTVGLA